MELLTPLETLCRIIIRAKENEAQVPAQDPDEDPDNVDDFDDEGGEALSVLEDELNSGVEEELRAILDDLADDQLAETLALAWVGRGTYDVSEWDDACAEANDEDPERADGHAPARLAPRGRAGGVRLQLRRGRAAGLRRPTARHPGGGRDPRETRGDFWSWDPGLRRDDD
jgi:hypothetical protein